MYALQKDDPFQKDNLKHTTLRITETDEVSLAAHNEKPNKTSVLEKRNDPFESKNALKKDYHLPVQGQVAPIFLSVIFYTKRFFQRQLALQLR